MPVPSSSSTPASRDGILLLTRASLAEGTRVLRRRDARLGEWIDRIGPVKLRRQRHRFAALCRSICAQQLAAGASRTIYRRFAALFAPARYPSAEPLLELAPATLRACGLSERKVEYLRALAREFAEGSLKEIEFSKLRDEEIVEALIKLPGIGVWTAEMFLIFSVGRLDVFSARDLALVNGVRRVEGRDLSAKEAEEVARRWAPYRSVASLYLWKIAQ